MTGADLILIVATLATVAVIAVLATRPGAAGTATDKALAFGGFFALPGLLLLGGANHHYQRAKSVEFCVSCHVIGPYRDSLFIDDPRFLPAAHFQNKRIPVRQACYACHSDYTMFGDVDDKIRGIRHVWSNLAGSPSGPVELYGPFPNRSCLECHQRARTYEEEPRHAAFKAAMLDGSRSCLMCHTLVHDAERLDRYPRWAPESGP